MASVELQYDRTVDTKNMDPEDDFGPAPPQQGVGPAPQPQGEYDLSTEDFDKAGNSSGLKPAFAETPMDHLPAATPVPQVGPGEPVVPDVEEEEEDGFAPELLAAAGLDEETATAQFGTPEALQAAVRMLDTQAVLEGRRAAQPAPQPQPQPLPQEYQTPQAPAVQPQGSDEYGFQLPPTASGEDWDDDTKTLVTALNAQTQKLLSARDAQIQQQQQAMQQYQAQQQQRNQQQYIEQFDGIVNELPEEWAPLLGQGRIFELSPQSMPFQNRVHLERTMTALQDGHARAGRAAMPFDELMVRALPVAFPDHHKAAVTHQVVEAVQQQQNKMSARPGRRKESQMTPQQRAVRSAESWYQQNNMSAVQDMAAL